MRRRKRRSGNWQNLYGSEKEEFIRDEKIKEITEVYNKLKLKELTIARIDSFFKLGLKSLDKVSISDSRKIILRNLIKRLIGRKK